MTDPEFQKLVKGAPTEEQKLNKDFQQHEKLARDRRPARLRAGNPALYQDLTAEDFQKLGGAPTEHIAPENLSAQDSRKLADIKRELRSGTPAANSAPESPRGSFWEYATEYVTNYTNMQGHVPETSGGTSCAVVSPTRRKPSTLPRLDCALCAQ
jgi:hypothetical protein